MKKLSTITLAVLIVASVLPAFAKEDLEQPIKVQARVYAFYHYDLTDYASEDDKGANEFDMSRAYVRFKGKITKNIKAEVTLDAGREYKYSLAETEITDDGGNVDYTYDLNKKKDRFRVFVKYAYLSVKFPDINHSIDAGMIKTPWIDYEQGIWDWRVTRKVAMDEYTHVNSADLGIGFKGDIVKDYVKHHLTFTNGEGYKKPEAFGGKDLDYRLSAFPLAGTEGLEGLSINGHVHYGNLMAKEDVDDTTELSYGGLLGFEHDIANVGAGYFMAQDGPTDNEVDSSIITAYATGHFDLGTDAGSLHPFARFDMVDPNTDGDNDAFNTIIGGVAYTFAGGWCHLIPNFQTTMPEADGSTDVRDFYIHTEFNF